MNTDHYILDFFSFFLGNNTNSHPGATSIDMQLHSSSSPRHRMLTRAVQHLLQGNEFPNVMITLDDLLTFYFYFI